MQQIINRINTAGRQLSWESALPTIEDVLVQQYNFVIDISG
jgi:hypothetical protein